VTGYGLQIGRNTATPVSRSTEFPFEFTGKLGNVTIDMPPTKKLTEEPSQDRKMQWDRGYEKISLLTGGRLGSKAVLHKVPLRSLHRGSSQLLVMSPDPKGWALCLSRRWARLSGATVRRDGVLRFTPSLAPDIFRTPMPPAIGDVEGTMA
jgi:hypothetical protein